EVTPARVAAQLDQRRAQHDAKDEPAVEPEDRRRRRAARERARIEERAEEDGEEAGLEELDLPAVAVPVLPDVDEGEVERPEDSHEKRVGEAGEDHEREAGAEPGHGEHEAVGGVEPEEAREAEERRAAGPEVCLEAVEEERDGREAVMAEQREQLLGEAEEGDEVHEAE